MGAYFDNNATTLLDPRVREAMAPWLAEHHGNPSAAHRRGREARHAVELARQQVAGLLGAQSAEIVFSASGTEALNTVVYAAGSQAGFHGHLVYSALEHPAVHAAVRRLARSGMELTEVPPDKDGVVQAEAILEALRPDTLMVALMLANNELGTLQPVARVAAQCRERGVAVLCDAVQAAGKVKVDVGELGVDFLVIGGHKFHAPPGAAALFIRDGLEVEPLLVGGGQEGGRRAGTENVPAIVGLGAACDFAGRELAERRDRLIEMRVRFERGLATIPDAVVHATGALRVPHTTHVAFPGVSGQQLAARLDELDWAVSTGAACHAGVPRPSRVLLLMGIAEAEALASLRVSFGIFNQLDEVGPFIETLATEVAALRRSAAAVGPPS